jgi:hypothetical protein
MSKIEVNEIVKSSGSTLTLGGCGTAVTLGSGATQTGFGRTGTVDWQTGSIKTSTFTAVDGQGFFANTSGGAFTMNLPAGSAGSIVSVVDYTNTFQTNNLTISPNGSQKIGGTNAPATLSVEGQSVTFIYVDDTEGWKNIQDSTSNEVGQTFIVATGGNAIVTSSCGNFKTHIFTAPGNFAVSSTATCSANQVADYVVVGGGASGGSGRGGGGGAGGFRLSNDTGTPAPTMSPLSNPTGVTISVQTYPIVVGAGGASRPFPPANIGNPGSASSGLGISSAGGGAGGSGPGIATAESGGSGGGGNFNVPGSGAKGSGNTPPVSPPQGNDGSISCSAAPSSPPDRHGGGGGGAGAVGGVGSNQETGGAGSFVADAFIGPTAPSYGSPGPVSSTRYFAGGGGAGFEGGPTGGTGGAGGGGAGGSTGNGTAGTTNTGGGGGATGENNPSSSGAGGSGIVMIRYRFQ